MREINVNCDLVDQEQHLSVVVLNNAIIIDTNHIWSQLKFLDAYYLKTSEQTINFGLKTSKELQLFKNIKVFIVVDNVIEIHRKTPAYRSCPSFLL